MKHACEFCGRYCLQSKDDTVCISCDNTLRAEHAAVKRMRELAWAEKHKCRKCGRGLPLARRFVCEGCVPEEHMPSETPLGPFFKEGHDTDCESWDEPTKKIRIVVSEKTCATCSQVKPAEEFTQSRHTTTGLHSMCRDCKRKSNRMVEAKARAAREEKKARAV